MIYCAHPQSQYLAYKNEIDIAIHTVLDGGQYILGKEVSKFEGEFANWNHSNYCIGVANGTDAIQLALQGLDIGRGDEVIVPSHTAVATAAAVTSLGATPVFADIDEYYCIHSESVERLISSNTKAIIAVHLYGNPANLNNLLEVANNCNLTLIEDCAQAHGAQYNHSKVGTFGVCSTYSFYPTKNLGALGDGGAVVTQDEGLAESIKSLRQYGWVERYISDSIGTNSRLDEIQASILRVKLRYLDSMNQRRRDIAKIYKAELANLPIQLPSVRPDCEHVFHLYVIRCKERDELMAYAKKHGVCFGIHYPRPIHQQKAYRDFRRDTLTYTDTITPELLSFPMYPELTNSAVEQVVQVLHNFYKR
jgi:dTDP-4-amino-4,6-dideoxygalactose transaminase